MRHRRGFTLTELLVTMAIIGLLTGLLVTNVSRSLSNNRLADDVTLLGSNIEQVRLMSGSTQQSTSTPGLQSDPDSAYYGLFFPASSTTTYQIVKISRDLNNGSCAVSQLATNSNCTITQVKLSPGVTMAAHQDAYIVFKAPIEELLTVAQVSGTWQEQNPVFANPFLQLTYNNKAATVTVDNYTAKVAATYQ